MKHLFSLHGNRKPFYGLMSVAFLSLFMLLAVFIVGCDKDMPDSPLQPQIDQQQIQTQIYFTRPLPLTEALQLAFDRGLAVTQLEQSFTVGEMVWTLGQPVTEHVPGKSIRMDLQKGYEALIQDMAAVVDQSFDDQTSNDLEKIKATRSHVSEDNITGMTVVGSLSALKELEKESTRIEQFVIPDNIKPLEKNQGEAVSSAANTWVPSAGTVLTAPSTDGNRFVWNSMKWNNVSGFSWNSTYEHDFFLNNSSNSDLGPGTYLDRDETFIKRIPNVLYWSSNLPKPYLDTRFSDPGHSVAYTIGSSIATNILVGPQYYTWIRTKKGDANRDNAKLIAQRGHREFPWNWYSTWNSYSDQQIKIYDAWDLRVPGSYRWSR